MPKCPNCGTEILELRYTTYGTYSFAQGCGWFDGDGDTEFRTPCCDIELEYEELEELQVF